MLSNQQSLELIKALEVFVEKYYDELGGKAYVDREEIGISRLYTNKIIIELDNVLELVVRFDKNDYNAVLTSGIDYTVIEAIRRESDTIDEEEDFEHALSPEAYRDEKDLANAELLEWVMMDVCKLEQIIDKLDEAYKGKKA